MIPHTAERTLMQCRFAHEYALNVAWLHDGATGAKQV